VRQGFKPVLWSAGGTAVTELPTLPGTTSAECYAINDLGSIVGYNLDLSGEYRAVLWSNDGSNTIIDLNTFLPANSHWVLERGLGIDNNGVIVGQAEYDPDGAGPLQEQYRAFRLVPVPEPEIGLAALILVGAHRRPRSRIRRHGERIDHLPTALLELECDGLIIRLDEQRA
jgi:probable HAF family extracellular repeat protein